MLARHTRLPLEHASPEAFGRELNPHLLLHRELCRSRYTTKGIKSGDRVRVSSKRGKVEVLALVTKRLGPMTVAGQTVYQIGIPIHWGYVGISADSDPSHGRYWLANALTPFVGDANARTPEFKAFLVNLEKI